MRRTAFLLLLSVFGCATAPERARVPVSWDLSAAAGAAFTYLDRKPEAGTVRRVTLDGVPYRGRPTKVFGYLGLPKTDGSRRVPGVVLLHGAGGSAFRSRVGEWMKRGYAALAVDLCGAIPGGEYGEDEFTGHRRSPMGGPPDCGGRATVGEFVTDQWPYHAVAAALRAVAALSDLPVVECDQVGVVGVDWGGYVAAMTASLDARVAFAVVDAPCGFMSEAGRRPTEIRAWRDLWHLESYLPNARCPFFWIAETNDVECPLDELSRARELVDYAPGRLAIRNRIIRSTGPRRDFPREAFGFADEVTGKGAAYPQCVRTGLHGSIASATFDMRGREAKMAAFYWTMDSGNWADRRWKSFPVDLDAGTVVSPVPEGASAWYFSVFFDGGSVISSDIVR